MQGNGFPYGYGSPARDQQGYPHGYGYGFPQQGWMGNQPRYNTSLMHPPQMVNWGHQFGATPMMQGPRSSQSGGAEMVINPKNTRTETDAREGRMPETPTFGRTNRQHELPGYLPKMPTFDGKSPSWTSFVNMFEMRARHLNLTDNQQLEKIILCLTGKAVDFYIKMREQGKCTTFGDFKVQMGTRFDLKDDASTLQSKFNSMRQYADEKEEDWSERVMTIGYDAFKGLTQDFIEGQIVRRYCSGSQDKEAAEHVLNLGPTTFEEAQRKMKQYRENRITIHGHSSRKVRTLSTEKDGQERNRSPYRSRRDRSPRRLSPAIYSNSSHDELLRKIEEVIELKLGRRRNRSPSPRNSERACFVCKSKDHLAPECPDKVDGACYICKETGHRYLECPDYKSENYNRSSL